MPGDFFEWITILIAIGSGVWVLSSKLTEINETLKRYASDNVVRDARIKANEIRLNQHEDDIRDLKGRLV